MVIAPAQVIGKANSYKYTSSGTHKQALRMAQVKAYEQANALRQLEMEETGRRQSEQNRATALRAQAEASGDAHQRRQAQEAEQRAKEAQQREVEARRQRIAAEQLAEARRQEVVRQQKEAVQQAERQREREAAQEAERQRLTAERQRREREAADEAERQRLSAERQKREREAAEEAERQRLAAEQREAAERARLLTIPPQNSRPINACRNRPFPWPAHTLNNGGGGDCQFLSVGHAYDQLQRALGGANNMPRGFVDTSVENLRRLASAGYANLDDAVIRDEYNQWRAWQGVTVDEPSSVRDMRLQLVKAVGQPGNTFWGTSQTLEILASILEVNIIVLVSSVGPDCAVPEYGDPSNPLKLLLYYLGQNHYQTLYVPTRNGWQSYLDVRTAEDAAIYGALSPVAASVAHLSGGSGPQWGGRRVRILRRSHW